MFLTLHVNEINICMLWDVFVSFLGFFLFTRFLHDVQKQCMCKNIYTYSCTIFTWIEISYMGFTFTLTLTRSINKFL